MFWTRSLSQVEGNFHLICPNFPFMCVAKFSFIFSLPGFWRLFRRSGSLSSRCDWHSLIDIFGSAGVYFHRQLGILIDELLVVRERICRRISVSAVEDGRFFCVPYIYDILRSVSSMNNRIHLCPLTKLTIISECVLLSQFFICLIIFRAVLQLAVLSQMFVSLLYNLAVIPHFVARGLLSRIIMCFWNFFVFVLREAVALGSGKLLFYRRNFLVMGFALLALCIRHALDNCIARMREL